MTVIVEPGRCGGPRRGWKRWMESFTTLSPGREPGATVVGSENTRGEWFEENTRGSVYRGLKGLRGGADCEVNRNCPSKPEELKERHFLPKPGIRQLQLYLVPDIQTMIEATSGTWVAIQGTRATNHWCASRWPAHRPWVRPPAPFKKPMTPRCTCTHTQDKNRTNVAQCLVEAWVKKNCLNKAGSMQCGPTILKGSKVKRCVGVVDEHLSVECISLLLHHDLTKSGNNLQDSRRVSYVRNATNQILQVRLADQARYQHGTWPSSLDHQSSPWVIPLLWNKSQTAPATAADPLPADVSIKPWPSQVECWSLALALKLRHLIHSSTFKHCSSAAKVLLQHLS